MNLNLDDSEKEAMENMKVLWILTIKNLKLLLRSRSSALIIIFAPLLIILLLGLSYNTSAKFGLKIGIHANSFTADVESFARLLEDEKEFTINRYEKDLQTCINDIKQSIIHTCISLPESLNVESNQQKILTFYIDPSRINLVWMIQETVQSKFNLKSQELSQELSANLISRLLETKEVITKEEANLQAIKKQTNSAYSLADSAQTSLENTDLSGDGKSADQIAEIDEALIKAQDYINDARSALSGAGIDDPLQEDEIKSDLNKAKLALDSIGGSNQTGLLAEVKTKIDSAATAIDSAFSDIDSIKKILDEAKTGLNTLQTSLSNVKSTLDQQRITDPGTVASPYITKVERVGQEGTYLNYLFPALLVLVVMFSSLLLGTTLVMIEKNSLAFLRNFFLPIRKINFIISIYLTNVVLNLVEISIILGISLFFLPESLSVIPFVGIILFIAGSVFTFLGMAIGYLFTSEETGVLASISLGSILLFTSGALLPLEGVSSWLRNILNYNPFVVAEKLVREVFIFKASLSAVAFEFGLLIGYVVILFLVIWGIESILHRQLTQKFGRRHPSKIKARKEVGRL